MDIFNIVRALWRRCVARLRVRRLAVGVAAGWRYVEVEPAAAYVGALREIAACLAKGRQPPGALGALYLRAYALPHAAWVAAWTPRDQMVDPAELALRAEALEIARLWFTEKLHQSIGGGPMRLRILRGDGAWRL